MNIVILCFHKRFSLHILFSLFIVSRILLSNERTFHQNIYFPYFHGSKTGKLSKSDLQVEKRDSNNDQTDKVGNKESPCNRLFKNQLVSKILHHMKILTACLYNRQLIFFSRNNMIDCYIFALKVFNLNQNLLHMFSSYFTAFIHVHVHVHAYS